MAPSSFTASVKRTAAAGLLAISAISATLGAASAQQAPAADPTFARSLGSQEQVAQFPQPPGQPGRPGRGDDGGNRPQLTDEQRQEMEQRRQEAEQRYVDQLAKNLGLDSATVKAALEQTQQDMQNDRVNEIKQAVSDGKLSQEQADQIIQRLQQGFGPMMLPTGPGFGPGLMPGGPSFGPGGPNFNSGGTGN
jgi:anti-sigma28 factor (negative regulator of flagellin synthesis)